MAPHAQTHQDSGTHGLHAIAPVHGSASLPRAATRAQQQISSALMYIFSKPLVDLCLAQLTRTSVNKAQLKKGKQETQLTQTWATNLLLHLGHQANLLAKASLGVRSHHRALLQLLVCHPVQRSSRGFFSPASHAQHPIQSTLPGTPRLGAAS